MPNWSSNCLSVAGDKKNVLKAVNQLKKVYDLKIVSLRDKLLEAGVTIDYVKVKPESGAYIGKHETFTRVLINGEECTWEEYAKVYNEVYAKAMQEAQIEENNGDDKLTFNNVVPMPVECRIDKQNTISPDKASGRCTDSDGWYGWLCDHWGTKWDMCAVDYCYFDSQLKDCADEADDAQITIDIVFQTAWSAPVPFVAEWSRQNPEVTITLEAEEESGAFFFKDIYQDGEVTESNEFSSRLEWDIYLDKDIESIIENATFGYDNDCIQDLFDGDGVTSLEELIGMLEKAGYTNIKDSIISSFPFDDTDKDDKALSDKLHEILSKITFKESEVAVSGTN